VVIKTRNICVKNAIGSASHCRIVNSLNYRNDTVNCPP